MRFPTASPRMNPKATTDDALRVRAAEAARASVASTPTIVITSVALGPTEKTAPGFGEGGQTSASSKLRHHHVSPE